MSKNYHHHQERRRNKVIMPQHVFITLEVDGDKVVNVEQPQNVQMNLPVSFYLVSKTLKNKSISSALNELSAHGWKLIDVAKGKKSSGIRPGIFPPLVADQDLSITYYHLQYPAD